MKIKRKIITATALAATLATGALPSTSVLAAEKEASIQVESPINIQPMAQNNLETAIHAALYGPEVKKIKVFEHEFNVKEIDVVDRGIAGKDVYGQISHHLSLRPDDQLYYKFTKKDGEVTGFEFHIDRGGWTPVMAPLLSIVAAYNGIPVNPSDLNKLGQELGALVDGRWEYAAQSIATAVSLSFDEK
ncbi:methyltransferase [Peribacillus sp. NPDC006672]|uniref:methyltransferase n=1 Tax=Peribacillus sp. NPDC006672 TaxID=3390606 RepID=UPI003D08A5EF